MNLGFITDEDWNSVAVTNGSLLLFAGLFVASGFCFLTSFAIIPSLVATHQLPAEPRVVRPLLYAFALVAFVIALIGLAVALVNGLAVVERLYPKWWI